MNIICNGNFFTLKNMNKFSSSWDNKDKHECLQKKIIVDRMKKINWMKNKNEKI